MEIERKFLIQKMPEHPEQYKSHLIEQAYLNVRPVVRVRREDENYYMTYKGAGMMVREEYNLPLTKDAYEHLIVKADGTVISKTRYRIPIGNDLTAELDIFDGALNGVLLVEVEFPDEAAARSFIPPTWFGEDVTLDPRYHNSNMSKGIRP